MLMRTENDKIPDSSCPENGSDSTHVANPLSSSSRTFFSRFCSNLLTFFPFLSPLLNPPPLPSHHPLPGYEYLPYEIKLFHKYLLQSPKYLFIYYFCYFCFIIGFLVLAIFEGPVMFHDSPSSSFYNAYFLLQATILLLLFPYQILFLSETLSSEDIPQMMYDVQRSYPRFSSYISALSLFNTSGFFIAILIYGLSVFGNPYRRGVEVIFFVVVLLPLPMCITISLIIMDCHRHLSNYYVEYLKYSTLTTSHYADETANTTPSTSQRTNSHLFYSSTSMKFYDLQTPLLSIQSFSLSNHLNFINSQYLHLRDGYLYTSTRRGVFISLLSINSLLLMGYLLWTVYLYTISFYSIVGFMIIDTIILTEVFIWTSLANEAGHLVTEALAEHTLRLLSTHSHLVQEEQLTGQQIQLIHYLITCLPYVRLEIYGLGRMVVRFKYAATITIGFAAAIIPKLILDG